MRLWTCSFSTRTRFRRSSSESPSQNSLIRSFSSAVVVFHILRFCRTLSSREPRLESPFEETSTETVFPPLFFFFFFLDFPAALVLVGVLLEVEEVAVIGIDRDWLCVGRSMSTRSGRSGISSSVKSLSSSYPSRRL